MSDGTGFYAALAGQLIEQWSELWRPPERLPLSRWAEKNFHLSPEYAGATRLIQLYAYQCEPLDCFTDPRVTKIVLMCGTQLLKTLLMQIAIAYTIAEDPGPSLISQPTDVDARAFSQERLAPMIRDNPKLAAIFPRGPKTRDASDTIGQKTYPGGSISLVGANAPGNFARRTIRYFYVDEPDKYQPTKEGDQIALGMERTIWFGSRAKTVIACSPTVAGRSRIAREYDLTDRRRPWVPCPECGQFQVLRFRSDTQFGKVHWEPGKPETARYICINPECGARWNDADRWTACERLQWRAEAEFKGAAGFWMSHLYSPKKTLGYIADDFLRKKGDRSTHQVFINTSLAELWREEGERPQWEIVKGLAEDYAINDEAIAPMESSFLTAAVDFQREWLHVELKACGRGRESWSLGMWKVELFDGRGNPLQTTDPQYREWLAAFLHRTWPHASGAQLSILAMALDTGERPDPVYEFARTQQRLAVGPTGARVIAAKTVIPVKGASTAEQYQRLVVGISKESAARKRGGIHIVSVGGGYAKGEFYGALALRRLPGGAYPSGYCHFSRRYDDAVFQGLVAEERVNHPSGSIEYVKIFDRNEPLDGHVYNRLCQALVGADTFSERQWLALERQQGINREALTVLSEGTPAPPASAPPKREASQEPRQPRGRVARSSFVYGG